MAWIYLFELTLTKLAVLAMYRRIFPAGFGVVRRGGAALAALTLAWLGGSVVLACVQCRPIQKTWDQALPGRCADPAMLALGSAVPNMALDLAILLLPVYEIARLRMAVAQKVAVVAIFFLGFL